MGLVEVGLQAVICGDCLRNNLDNSRAIEIDGNLEGEVRGVVSETWFLRHYHFGQVERKFAQLHDWVSDYAAKYVRESKLRESR